MRLKSTTNRFRNKVQTTITLLTTTHFRVNRDEQILQKFRISLLHTKRPETLKDTYTKLSKFLMEQDYKGLPYADKEIMLDRIRHAKRKNSYLIYTSNDQAIISLCTIFEEYVRTIILKYYEEDIRRLITKQETISGKKLIDTLIRGDNVHRTLAEITVDKNMQGGIEKWREFMVSTMKMDFYLPSEVKELFLIRNCVVHNNNIVSDQLHSFLPEKYQIRGRIHLKLEDVITYKHSLMNLSHKISTEYNRLFPKNRGTWLYGRVYDD